MKLKNLIAVFCLLITSLTFAQEYNVRGFIYDKEDGEPLPYISVRVQPVGSEDNSTIKGGLTDIDGFYSIPKLNAGEYTLRIVTDEYKAVERNITLEGKTTILNLSFDLDKLDEVKDIDGVTVTAASKESKTEIQMSVLKLDQKGLERIPSMGGENDIVAAFGVTPGVVTTGDQGGQIYVRGGTPIQNKILLDGMTIYNPFHSIGFFSVFETELVKSADIYTGGFGSEFGGRISSIMDITYRDGSLKKFSGKVSASPFMAKAVLEGPLFRPKDTLSRGGGSYIFSVKKSILEQTSRTLYPYVNDGLGLPFEFTDVYGKLTFKGGEGSKVSVFGFNNRDAVNYPNIASLGWQSSGGGLNFLLVPNSSPIFIKGHLNASNYAIDFVESDGEAPRSSSIFGFDLGFDFTYFLGNQSEVNYGLNVGGFNTNFVTYNELDREIRAENFSTEIGAYLNYRIVKGLWVIQPGIRVQAYASLSAVVPEPRLGIKYNVNENFRIKVSGGRYSQNFTSASSDKDVVTLFYGFLSAPTNTQSQFTQANGKEKDVRNGIQKAWHGIAGFEYDLSKRWSLNVEGYYKYFDQLSNINSNKLYEETAENSIELANIDDVFKKDFVIESGYAMGADLLLKYTTERIFIWGVYSIGKVQRWDGFQYYTPVFDRRHNINLVGTYLFGEDKDLELSLRWNLGTGLPFTETTGYYQGESFDDGLTTDYTTSNSDDLNILYGELNGGRLPTYHRFDITIKKRFEFKNKSLLEVTGGVTNIYNRENIFYVNRVTNEKVYQLPVLPSIGISYKF